MHAAKRWKNSFFARKRQGNRFNDFSRRHSAPGGDHERDRRVRERSLCSDDALGRFRYLEALEEQPEGEQENLERCDGNGKERP
jgi:hypothetical protein